MSIDRNKTVWQNLNDKLREVMERDEADALTAHLHPYVVAERADARRGVVTEAA